VESEISEHMSHMKDLRNAHKILNRNVKGINHLRSIMIYLVRFRKCGWNEKWNNTFRKFYL
jgi:hypothetical protein